MKKSLFTIFAIACISFATLAQGRWSVGAELALPAGDWEDFVSTGFGASARYERPINDNLSWMATAGVLVFSGKDFYSSISWIQVPVHGGIKYYFSESFNGFYAGAELGFTSVSASSTDSFSSVSETKLSYAPLVGYHLGKIDIGAKYQLVDGADYIGFRVAYVFGGN